MSRLRRLVITGRIFFVTCNVLRGCPDLGNAEFKILADAMARVRKCRGFLLTGYVFMPDHWHALVAPSKEDTLPKMMNALKVASAHEINRSRGAKGQLWQRRYYDHIIRTVKDSHATLHYMHLNPVSKGLVGNPEQWRWSSFQDYAGPTSMNFAIDRLDLPADESTRL